MDDSMLAAELGRMRREAGLSQEKLAAKLTAMRRERDKQSKRVSQSYVTKLETGARRATFEQASEWATACGFELRVEFALASSSQSDPLVMRAAQLLPYAPPDLRSAIAGLLEAVAREHQRRAVR
jgi:transcriptional regulator with XRE-family HTH domain